MLGICGSEKGDSKLEGLRLKINGELRSENGGEVKVGWEGDNMGRSRF